ncbi:hypothetical protein B0A48_02073 [Cryoendolithus antarcticus]|uniref:Uncharacterized protein n=1 Tax=Cryoendolithus antarcticus TaxID=1507870 RepID=A0A1V8TMY7_9PEZI|nr:hypothetical protein B0A48_02073 [Cryoendolithus antarcticus]
MTVFTMKNILLIAQLTSFALASGSLEEVTTIAAAPTMQLASAEPTALIPNHVDPNNLPPAWPKPISSITSTHNHTTASTSAATAVHPPTTTYLTNVHVPTTTAATDTYPPGPAAFYSTGVNLGAAAKSSGLTTSSSCTSTKITSKSTHTMTTTHTIPALPPSEVTLPVQSQHGGEHHESGLGGGMVNGTGVAHGTGTKKHWPTQPAGHHGKPPGVAGVHPSGMPSSHCEHETGTTQHKPTRAAGRHERPQGQDCAHPSGMSNAQVRYGTGAAPAKSTQSPWEPGHPMGPPPGVSPKEWQQHGGEHGQGRQAGQHSYPGVDGTGTFVWAPAPHTTTLKAPGTTIYTSTRTIFLTVFATATTHATTTLLPLADADMTSIWTPDVWSSQHRNSTQHKNGPTAFAGHAAPTGLPAARANCTMTFTKRPEFFECTSTKYQSTTTTFMDCHGCTGKHVTTVIGKDAHVCPTHTPHITLSIYT